MKSDEALGAFRRSQEFGNRNGRSVGCEDRVFFHDAVERGVHLFLFSSVFDHGLDDDVAVGQVLHVRRALEPGTNGLRGFLERTFLGEFGQRLLDAGKTFVEILLLDLEDGDIESGCGRDLRDPRAHQSATENTNFVDFHTIPSIHHRGTEPQRKSEHFRIPP